MSGCDIGWKTPSMHAIRKQNEQTDRSSSHANNDNHNIFSTFEEDDEEYEEISEESASTSVVLDVINNRKTNEVKVRCKEEDEEEKK